MSTSGAVHCKCTGAESYPPESSNRRAKLPGSQWYTSLDTAENGRPRRQLRTDSCWSPCPSPIQCLGACAVSRSPRSATSTQPFPPSVGERSVVEMDRAVAVNRMLLKGNAWDRFGTKACDDPGAKWRRISEPRELSDFSKLRSGFLKGT